MPRGPDGFGFPSRPGLVTPCIGLDKVLRCVDCHDIKRGTKKRNATWREIVKIECLDPHAWDEIVSSDRVISFASTIMGLHAPVN